MAKLDFQYRPGTSKGCVLPGVPPHSPSPFCPGKSVAEQLGSAVGGVCPEQVFTDRVLWGADTWSASLDLDCRLFHPLEVYMLRFIH